MDPPNAQQTVFGLLRHGKTLWNREKRIQGRRDSPLSGEGIAACRQWGRFLSKSSHVWNLIVSSPLPRAVATTEIINEQLALPVYTEEGLREQDWGEWEGLTLEDIKARFPGELERRVQAGWDFRPPGGESRKEVQQRVEKKLIALAARWPQTAILVVTHLGVIKTLLYSLENRQFLPEEPQILYKNRLHLLHCQAGRLSLEKSNISLPESE